MIILKSIWWIVKYGFQGLCFLIVWPIVVGMTIYDTSHMDLDAKRGMMVLFVIAQCGWGAFIIWAVVTMLGGPA